MPLLLPRATAAEMPICSSAAQPAMAAPMVPLWATTAMEPARSMRGQEAHSLLGV